MFLDYKLHEPVDNPLRGRFLIFALSYYSLVTSEQIQYMNPKYRVFLEYSSTSTQDSSIDPAE